MKKCYVGDICICHKTLLSGLLRMINKLFKTDFVAITNPFSLRVHVVDRAVYEEMGKDYVLFRHELCHVWQVRRDGKIKFVLNYLLSFIRNGFKYNKIDYEVEAYDLQWHSKSYIDVYYENEIGKGK